jgi:ubiquinone/menaquinone biosynthesis C-methylase UbiE
MSFVKPDEVIKHLGLSAGKAVADIGAGTGHYVFLMSEIVGREGVIYAIDIQKNLLENIAKQSEERGITNVHTVWGDAENIGGTKLKSGAVDLVLISNVLFQTQSKSGLVHEVKRILKKNGKAVVVDWAESFGGLGPDSLHVVTEETARSLFENNGFILEKIFEAGAHHYGLVFKHVE